MSAGIAPAGPCTGERPGPARPGNVITVADGIASAVGVAAQAVHSRTFYRLIIG